MTFTLDEIDHLARQTQARTVLLGDEVSVYSPFDVARTSEFAKLIEEQRGEVFGLLGIAPGKRVFVQLHPNEGMGMRATSNGEGVVVALQWKPVDGFLGLATKDVVLIEVAPTTRFRTPDGREVTGHAGVGMYRDTIRHELVHVATARLGVRGANWLKEGIAHALEWIPVHDGRLVLDPAPARLRRAAQEDLGPGSLERLLAWKQGHPPTDVDRPMRWMAFSFFTFLLTQKVDGDVREGLLEIARWSPARLRALEPEWRAWLATIEPTDT